MLLGPVFRYELYSIARRTRYFWLRSLFGLALLVVMWTCYSSVSYRGGQLSIDQAARLADSFFQGFAWLALCAVLMIAPALSAGVIATERERRTIEYLFATDLRNSEIVLSKLVARLLLLGLLLSTALPILALFRLMGGISSDKLLACFTILASTGVAITATAIAISVWSPRGRDALGRVYLVLLAVLLVPMILSALASGLFGSSGWWGGLIGQIARWLMIINPLWCMAAMSSFGFDMRIVWEMLIAHAVVSVALIALAVSAVRRVHLQTVSGGDGGSRSRRRKMELPRWRRPLGERPMLWKEIFARTASTKLGLLGRVAATLAVGGLLLMLGYSYFEALSHAHGRYNYPYDFFDETALGIGSAIGSGALLLCGARAASLVTYEKERDTWLSIISTPMTGREILAAKLAGNLYAFRWLGAVLLLVWGMAFSLNPAFLLAIPFLVGTLLLLAIFSTLVGLIFSLRLSSSLRASVATMATLFFVGGGYLFCCCMPLMISSGPSSDMENIIFATCAPFLLFAPGEFVDSSMADEAISNYVIGMIGYSIVTVCLWVSLDSGFDTWAGRIGSDPYSPEPTTPSNEKEITPPEQRDHMETAQTEP